MRNRDRRKPGGYAARRELQRAIRANAKARNALRGIADHVAASPTISPLLISQLLTNAALALAEGSEALRELEQINRKET